MARVSEAVNSGEDLVLDQDEEDHGDQPDKQNEDGKEGEEIEEEEKKKKSSSGEDINILSSRLDKTEQSLDSLGSHQLLLSDLLCSVIITELMINNAGRWRVRNDGSSLQSVRWAN